MVKTMYFITKLLDIAHGFAVHFQDRKYHFPSKQNSTLRFLRQLLIYDHSQLFCKTEERSYLQELFLLFDYMTIFQVQVPAYYDEIIIPDMQLMINSSPHRPHNETWLDMG